MTVFYSHLRSAEQSTVWRSPSRSSPRPVAVPVPMSAAGGSISADGVQRSEVIGEHGAIAKLDVPG